MAPNCNHCLLSSHGLGRSTNARTKNYLIVATNDSQESLSDSAKGAKGPMKYIPPWKEPYFIAIAGCSGSGKTSITAALIQKLNVPWTVLLSMDNFYRPLDAAQRERAFQSEFDFDQPGILDFELLMEVLQKLKRGEKTEVPVYSFKEHNRTSQTVTLYGANVVILEGIYALYDPRVLELMDLKIFVSEDYDVCMARRLHRDILYRGRELQLSMKQWHRFVKPNYLTHVLPTAKSANMLIPRGMENHVALNMLFLFVKRQLAQKSAIHLENMRKLGTESGSDVKLSSKVTTLDVSNQVQALQTMVANQFCNREDFIYAVDRLAGRLVYRSLDVLWRSDQGPDQQNELCAVTMVRGGECFETALRRIVPTIFLGRLLILSDSTTGEPKLHLSKVPSRLDERTRVILTDAQIISGAAAVMAIAVLVDHGAAPHNIAFAALAASEIGARRIHAAFPEVNMFFGRVDAQPEMLAIDERYFGTYTQKAGLS